MGGNSITAELAPTGTLRAAITSGTRYWQGATHIDRATGIDAPFPTPATHRSEPSV